MKKAAVSFVFFLGFAGISQAQTSPKIAQFLKKVDLYYYCLNREGLRHFTCDAGMNLPQVLGQVQKKVGGNRRLLKGLRTAKYQIQYDVKTGLTVSGGNPQETKHQNLNNDIAVAYKSGGNFLGVFFRLFNSLNIHPLFTDSDLSGRSYDVQTRKSGFDVDADGIILSFDKKVRLLPAWDSPGKIPVPGLRFGFLNTPKGLLISRLLDKQTDGSGLYKVEYGNVGRFKLPRKLTVFSRSPQPSSDGLTFVFHFTNYDLK